MTPEQFYLNILDISSDVSDKFIQIDIDFDNVAHVEMACNIAAKRAFGDLYFINVTDICQGTADGDMIVLLPNGNTK